MAINWRLIENQPLLKTIIFERPPITSYKRDKSLKDMLVLKSKNVTQRHLIMRRNHKKTHWVCL